MNEHSPEPEIRDHYQRISLAPQRVEAILETGDLVLAARRWKRAALAAAAGLAAMTLLSLGLYIRNAPRHEAPATANPVTPGEDRQIGPAQNAVAENETKKRGPPPRTSPRYRLVAFRSHSDQCPHCRATGEVYRELVQALPDVPMEFEEFDLSRPATREIALKRVRALQLEPLIQGRQETAFLALLGPGGSTVQEFKPSQGVASISSRIRDSARQ